MMTIQFNFTLVNKK